MYSSSVSGGIITISLRLNLYVWNTKDSHSPSSVIYKTQAKKEKTKHIFLNTGEKHINGALAFWSSQNTNLDVVFQNIMNFPVGSFTGILLPP